MIYTRVILITILTLIAVPLEAAIATWDRNPEPNIAGYRLSYGTQSGQHTVSIDVGNVVSYEFFPPPGQRYYVVVQAYNTSGLGPKSAEVIYDEPPTTNRPPVLTQPTNQSHAVNATVSLALVASDPDGNVLSYAATGLPPGLSVHAVTGVISGTLATAGTYTVTATVSDGALSASRTFTWTVTPPINQPPVLTQPANQSHAVNATVSLALVASDPNGNALSYAATGLPSGLSVHAITGVISGTLATAGTYTVTATVSDGALSASRTFTWTVTPPINQPPVLTQPANQSHAVNATVSQALVASDPNGNVLSYAATGLPPGLSVHPATGVISGTLTTAGAYTVTATVSDGTLSASRTFTWTVTTGSQTTTVALVPAGDTTINIDDANYVSQPRLSAYTYPRRKVANAILMKFDLASIPANAIVQSAALQMWLIEMDGDVFDVNYTVSLHQVINRNPDLTRVTGRMVDGTAAWTPNKCCQKNIPMAQADISPARSVAAINRTPGAKTWDALALVQAWRAAPASNFGLLLNADATKPADRYRTFASSEYATAVERPLLRITYTVPGSLNPALSESAGTSEAAATSEAAHTTAATAIAVMPNRPPVVAPLPNPVNRAGDTVSLQVAGSDPDGGPLAYQATGLPPSLSIDPSTGLISGTLGADAAGLYEVTVAASDGHLAATQPFTWSVTGSDLPLHADFDGDGRTDLATYRVSSGEWRLWLSGSNGAATNPISFGAAGDVPVPADYDGDRRADIAVYSPSTGTWQVLLSSTNMASRLEIIWGDAGDVPMPYDHDNDGRADLALHRLDGFEILLSSTNYKMSVTVK